MKSLVIAGSVSLQKEISYWKQHWEDANFTILAYPDAIPKETFLQDYPEVHKNFFASIERTDVLFIMNENKNGTVGYIGAETFAELVFGIAQNLLHHKNIEIILLQMPGKDVQSYNEITLWLELGWIKLLK